MFGFSHSQGCTAHRPISQSRIAESAGYLCRVKPGTLQNLDDVLKYKERPG
uniref:Uncharacterized protein n=1 Tax=Anguilla anguilla TaxID=7936 RepID=A0A0E9TK20_ANGAN